VRDLKAETAEAVAAELVADGRQTTPREPVVRAAELLAERRVPDLAVRLAVEREIAHQRHEDFDRAAWGGYATFGTIGRDLTWSPSLSYRYSARSGDDADTATCERFDPLYAGGLSEWLEGVSISKGLKAILGAIGPVPRPLSDRWRTP